MLSSRKDDDVPEPDQEQPETPLLEPDDPELDSLGKLLDNALKLQTRAIAASRLVKVDKNYSLFSAITASQFYKYQVVWKRVDKRKRDEGIVSNSTTRRRLGFRPEELLWNGALELKGCKPSNLTNEIHTLFGLDRFDDCPDHIYDQFKPALRLATLFLTTPICFQFWVTVGLGIRKFDAERSYRCGYETERIEKNVPMTKENTSRLIDYINELDQATLVHFNFHQVLTLRGQACWAIARQICDYYVEKPVRPFTDIQRHNVNLHGDFYIAAQKSSQLTYPNPAQQLRFHFFLAVVLVHELAHVVEGAHRRVRVGPRMSEPFLFDHKVKEMGAAWESMMFGGRIQPINGRVDGTHGLSVYNWPGDDDLDESSDRHVFYSVPMGYIEGMFQMKSWQRDFQLENWKLFHIPRDGAPGIYSPSFTTMPWKEEVREMEIDMEELNLSDPDKPSRKRRETRTGSAVVTTKGYGEELKRNQPSSRDPPGKQRPVDIARGVVRRNLRAVREKRDKAAARQREKAEEKMKTAKESEEEEEKRKEEEREEEERKEEKKKEETAEEATENPQEKETNPEDGVQQTNDDNSPNDQNKPKKKQKSPPRHLHPRIWQVKRVSADDVNPLTWPGINLTSTSSPLLEPSTPEPPLLIKPGEE